MAYGGRVNLRASGMQLGAAALGCAVLASLLPCTAALAQLPPLPSAEELAERLERARAAANIPPPQLQVIDTPSDDGSSLLLLVTGPPAGYSLLPEVEANGAWQATASTPVTADLVGTKADSPQYFGFHPADPESLVFTISSYLVPAAEPGAEATAVSLETGQTYNVQLALFDSTGQRVTAFPAGSAVPREQWFNLAKANNLIICTLLSLIILGAIAVARRNPNLFIRRINGLEAVDEAVGRATEMGKPVFHINGLDGLTVLSTLAGVNILGRIARITANYETQLVVPAFDPVVLNVSQEVVRQAYIEAGRPDAFRADDIFFVTDQQFSYVASVCGMMLRDRPAAIFLLGSFYAESLMLAETGASTGAIQIAGTDQQAQLPFFITTCDYTLIGEELYAASAYLSREPLLLGSLKGQDVGKALITLLILIGVVMQTAFHSDWLVNLFTAL